MRLRTLLLIVAVGVAGYWGYVFVMSQFNPVAMAYKRYASTLLDDDISRARSKVYDQDGLAPFQAGAQRREFIDGKVRFVWYSFVERRDSRDGRTVILVVDQNIRVDSPGSDTLFGNVTRQDRHSVTLIKDKSTWKIKDFQDTATRRYQSQQR